MQFVSIAQASKVLGLSRSTIRTRLKTGEWPSHRFGERAVRVNLEELAALSRCDSKTRRSEDQNVGAKNER